MTVWEPDGWNFSDTKTKLTVLESDGDSDTESSDDEQLVTKSKKLRKSRYKKSDKEELLPE